MAHQLIMAQNKLYFRTGNHGCGQLAEIRGIFSGVPRADVDPNRHFKIVMNRRERKASLFLRCNNFLLYILQTNFKHISYAGDQSSPHFGLVRHMLAMCMYIFIGKWYTHTHTPEMVCHSSHVVTSLKTFLEKLI